MNDLDDSKLKNEIDDIMQRVDSIMGKIEEIYPTAQENADSNTGQENTDKNENLSETK